MDFVPTAVSGGNLVCYVKCCMLRWGGDFSSFSSSLFTAPSPRRARAMLVTQTLLCTALACGLQPHPESGLK